MYNFNEGGNINSIAKVVEKISLAAVPEYIQKYISADPFLIAQSNTFLYQNLLNIKFRNLRKFLSKYFCIILKLLPILIIQTELN